MLSRNKSATVTIKKYANRRLYNTATSCYVTLNDLSAMVRDGEDFIVVDARTGEDLTRVTLNQIVMDEEGKSGQPNLLPVGFLRQLISFYGGNMQWFVPEYLEQSLRLFAANQEQLRKYIDSAFGDVFPFSSAMEEAGRKNLAMLSRAFGMFAPFAQAAGDEATGASAEPSADSRSKSVEPAKPSAKTSQTSAPTYATSKPVASPVDTSAVSSITTSSVAVKSVQQSAEVSAPSSVPSSATTTDVDTKPAITKSVSVSPAQAATSLPASSSPVALPVLPSLPSLPVSAHAAEHVAAPNSSEKSVQDSVAKTSNPSRPFVVAVNSVDSTSSAAVAKTTPASDAKNTSASTTSSLAAKSFAAKSLVETKNSPSYYKAADTQFISKKIEKKATKSVVRDAAVNRSKNQDNATSRASARPKDDDISVVARSSSGSAVPQPPSKTSTNTPTVDDMQEKIANLQRQLADIAKNRT